MDVWRGRSDAQSGQARHVGLNVQAQTKIDAEAIALARAGEPERYIAATLAPAEHRPALIALAAFSADLRRIPSLVKEPMMGEIRLQWWRDAIDRFNGNDAPTGHPVADALRDAVRRYDLPIEPLIAMTESRAFDIYADPMPDRGAFEGYITKTEAMPFELALEVLGADRKASTATVEMAGRCYGFARLLAELPYRLQRGRNPLPLDLLATHHVDIDALMRGEADLPIRTALRDLVGEARSIYPPLRSRWRELPSIQRPALLPIATITAYLAGLDAQTRNPLTEPFELQPLTRIWRMARAHWIGP